MSLTFVRVILVPSGFVAFAITVSLGLFVYLQDPRRALNRFYAIFALSIGCWSIGSSLENVIVDERLALGVLRMCYLSASLLPTFFLHFTLTLTRRVSSHRHLLCGAYIASAAFALLTFTDLFVRRLRVINPWGFRISDPGPAYFVYVGFFGFCLAYGLWMMYRQGRRTEGGDERRRLQYILLSHVIAFLAGVEYFVRVFRIVDFPPVDDYILLVYFLVFAYAVVRHQLLDIRIVVRRSLVYSLLVACLTATYFAVVLISERWLRGLIGYHSLVATVFVSFLITIFFNPLRHWLQSFVDRALFKATPAELVAQREQLLAEVRKTEQLKAVATLAAGLAHEVKNPLAAIKTFTDFLESRYDDPEFRAKFTKIVGGEVERMNHIVQQLLDFAKPVPPKLTPVSVGRLLDETLSFLSQELVERRIEVDRVYRDAVPLAADPQQLKQVFLNLLLNSLEAMNGAGRLVLRTETQGTKTIVTITDNGCGIRHADHARLFQPFFTTKAKGTGLGLAVVRSIIEEHRGSITITSEPGQGTTVTLLLPHTESGA
ncbi:MAG: GHKL domain-containing protein [Candidatus Omnitrophica bacterium]|nr:GHKL domain-containing protein [Candidatus Omnitrophota bacterium]